MPDNCYLHSKILILSVIYNHHIFLESTTLRPYGQIEIIDRKCDKHFFFLLTLVTMLLATGRNPLLPFYSPSYFTHIKFVFMSSEPPLPVELFRWCICDVWCLFVMMQLRKKLCLMQQISLLVTIQWNSCHEHNKLHRGMTRNCDFNVCNHLFN